jgi:hypothetical protein
VAFGAISSTYGLWELRSLKRVIAAEGFGEVDDGQKSKDFSVISDNAAE